MRLLLLPISTRRALIYCEPASHAVAPGKRSRIDQWVNKAGETWAAWEKSPTTWKAKTTQYGNMMFRRIPFEEWGLKSIPARKGDLSQQPTASEEKVQIKFPGKYIALGHKSVIDLVGSIATGRQELHKTRLYWSLGCAPLTAPFALIPVIPNLPFFYLCFRAYSHWRALNGSKNLEYLHKNNLLDLKPDPTLDSLYTVGLLHGSQAESRKAATPTAKETEFAVAMVDEYMHEQPVAANAAEKNPQDEPTKAKEVMLLRGWNAKLIADALKVPTIELEIERAVEQVQRDVNANAEKSNQGAAGQAESKGAAPSDSRKDKSN